MVSDESESELEEDVKNKRRNGGKGVSDKWHAKDYQQYYKDLMPAGRRNNHLTFVTA